MDTVSFLVCDTHRGHYDRLADLVILHLRSLEFIDFGLRPVFTFRRLNIDSILEDHILVLEMLGAVFTAYRRTLIAEYDLSAKCAVKHVRAIYKTARIHDKSIKI